MKHEQEHMDGKTAPAVVHEDQGREDAPLSPDVGVRDSVDELRLLFDLSQIIDSSTDMNQTLESTLL